MSGLSAESKQASPMRLAGNATSPRQKKIKIFHNLKWPRYKGAIFTEAHRIAKELGVTVEFSHIASTDSSRQSLSQVDGRYHNYPHEVIFEEAYNDISTVRLVAKLMLATLRTDAHVVVLPGYSSAEHWAMLAVALVRRKRIAVFCDSTANDRPRTAWKAALKRFFFARCDAVIAYGVRSAEYLGSLGVPARKIAQPCQAAAVLQRPRDQRLLSRRGNQIFKVLFVGRLAPEKGLHLLISAFDEFLRHQGCSELEIVGDGPLRAQLEEQVRIAGISDRVTLSGALPWDQLPDRLAMAHVLVLPSFSEPWGLVANEALYYGCPVIASDVCGCIPELVQERITGLTFRTGDQLDLLRALRDASHLFWQGATVNECLEVGERYTPLLAARTMMSRLVSLC